MKRLEAKIAAVTGAGSGPQDWGHAMAVTFAREGAYVVCVDADQNAAEKTAAAIADDGGAAIAVCADVTDDEQVAAVFDRIANDHGRLDVLGNTIGLRRGGGVVDTSADDWDLAMTVNVTSAYLAMKHAVGLMRGGGGSIVNVSSIESIRYGGAPDAGFAAAKAALNHLTRITAAEYAPQQIRVNAVLPGPPSSAWDVANAALFFAADASQFVTGMELVIDGGASLSVRTPAD